MNESPTNFIDTNPTKRIKHGSFLVTCTRLTN